MHALAWIRTKREALALAWMRELASGSSVLFAQTLEPKPIIFSISGLRAVALISEKKKKSIKATDIYLPRLQYWLADPLFLSTRRRSLYSFHLIWPPPSSTLLLTLLHPSSRPQAGLLLINSRSPWWFQVDFSGDVASSLKLLYFSSFFPSFSHHSRHSSDFFSNFPVRCKMGENWQMHYVSAC